MVDADASEQWSHNHQLEHRDLNKRYPNPFGEAQYVNEETGQVVTGSVPYTHPVYLISPVEI